MKRKSEVKISIQLIIETQRLILRDYQYTDWKAVHEYSANGEILIFQKWGANTEEETQAFVKEAIEESRRNPRRAFELVIILKSSGALIGGIGSNLHPEIPQQADLGYIINPNHWQKGYATEAALALVQHMIEQEGIQKLEATCAVLNLASQRVLEKCGFKRVKTLKNHLELEDRVQDSFLYEYTI